MANTKTKSPVAAQKSEAVGTGSFSDLSKLEYAQVHIAAGLEGQAHMKAEAVAARAKEIATAIFTPEQEEEA